MQTDHSASIKSQKLNSKFSSGKLLHLETVVGSFPELYGFFKIKKRYDLYEVLWLKSVEL